MISYQSNGKRTVSEIEKQLQSEFQALPWKDASAYILEGSSRKEVPPDYIPGPAETVHFRLGSC